MKRLIVCGGRGYNDFIQMHRCLSSLHEKVGIEEIIEGGATGADSMANYWATYHGIKVTTILANWDAHGKSAGAIRNKEMLDMKPDGVVAFPGGTGTAHMIKIAKEAAIPVWQIIVD